MASPSATDRSGQESNMSAGGAVARQGLLWLVFALASCDAPVGPAQAPEIALSRAQVFHETVASPLPEDVDCTGSGGELIQLTGTVHLSSQLVEKQGQFAYVLVHHSVSGVTGTGLTSGRTYRGTGSTFEVEHARIDSSPIVSTVIDRTHLVQGGAGAAGSIWALKITTHLTISASGQVSSHDIEQVTCELAAKAAP
jgi:hypothetical protein